MNLPASFAAALGVSPSIGRPQLRGVILYCGGYDLGKINLEGPFGGFMRTALWSYFGRKDFLAHPLFATASVIDYLGARDLVVAATHDLEVAAQVDARFARGYFCEPDGGDRFDRRLRPGVSPSSNALALLVRAGYPAAIIAAAERRAGAAVGQR